MKKNRIERIRERFLAHGGFRGDPENTLYQYQGWLSEMAPIVLRRAKAKAFALRNITTAIDEDELIVGKPFFRELNAEEMAIRDNTTKAMISTAGQAAHMSIDYSKLLRLGIAGVLDEIAHYRSALDLADPANVEKELFYSACTAALEGVLDCSDRYAACARSLADGCGDPARKEELIAIGRNCSTVPRYPARTFWEGLQSMHFITFCMKNPTFQTGRPDRLLIGLYRKDIQAGTITEDAAQELIDCFCMQFNERAGRGTSLGFMVGGRDSSGNDVSNELTAMFIESIAHTRLAYPSIGLCVTDDTPPELLARSARILAAGASHPALFNDEVIVRGLRRYGLPKDEACEYIHSSCVEITPVASSGVWVASPYHNLVQYLLDIIGVPQSGEGRTPAYESFDALVGAYRTRLGEAVRTGVIAENTKQAERSHAEGEEIIAACFTNDCLERGLSLDKGGARYNWIMPSFVGLANLADSLLAIRSLVFGDRSITLTELADALRNDFCEHEYLRLQIMNRVPHYGNDDDAADAMVAAITGWLVEETSRYTTFRGGRFIPSLFCWVMHERLGKETPASPDGRRAGDALGDGSGPAQGREMKGPTASILSSTKWDHAPFIGGIAVNMKFGKRNFSNESLEKMIAVMRTFFARGGFELQVNVVDRDTLLAARAQPERYKDLVVRIGGYSDYYTSLTPAMQEEILQRTEHAL